MAEISILDVLLHDEPIGTLNRLGGDQTIFSFNDSYIKNEQRSVLGLGFKDTLGQLITYFRPVQKRVMPWFANLMPEGHMRTYLAERAGLNPSREFFLLWVLGTDLPGAITIRHSDGEAWPPDADDHNDEDRNDDAHRGNALRFSLAGVQLKFSAIHEARGGLTIPARGVGGSWIVKLPSREFDGVPENEYAMMTLAGMIGMNVPPVRLVDVSAIGNLPDGIGVLKGQALAVERFDRMPGAPPVHTEDFAQIFGVYPERKYERANYRNIATVIGAEGSDEDIAEFVRRLTFNMLIGNADMHLKNWSLIYPDRRMAALAPAYDFVSTVAYLPDSGAALNVSRTRRFDEFTEDELSHLAAGARLPEKFVLDTAHETVALFFERWQAERKNLPLAANVVTAIDAHLKTIPLAQSA